MRENYRLTLNLLQAQRQSEHAAHLLEDAVLRALHQLALEKQSYVRTAVIANRLELPEQLPGPRNSTYASTVVLAICRRLHDRGLVKVGRREGAAHHSDKTTAWMIGAGEYQRRQATSQAAANGEAASGEAVKGGQQKPPRKTSSEAGGGAAISYVIAPTTVDVRLASC